MLSRVIKMLALVLGGVPALCVYASAQCPVDTVIVKGRVENATPHSMVRVQLVFPKEKPGESGETTVENGAFQIPVEFLTMQSSIFTNLRIRCGRKPKTVVITLLENDQESDQVFLDFSKSFKTADPSSYALRSEVVLSRPH